MTSAGVKKETDSELPLRQVIMWNLSPWVITQHLTSRTPSLQVVAFVDFFYKWEAKFTKTSRYDCDLQNEKSKQETQFEVI